MFRILSVAFVLALPTAASGFERAYVKQAVLSKEEEKTVIELAKKRGVGKICGNSINGVVKINGVA